jgi:ribonuclease HII
MAWRVGVDEAGYGPNLGPLVMSAVACRVPEEAASGCLWKLLRRAVRKVSGRGKSKLPVDDSKKVYSTVRGLADLEHSVLAILGVSRAAAPASTPLTELLERVCPKHDLGEESWYRGDTALPVSAPAENIHEAAERFAAACADAGVSWALFRSVVVCTPRFNGMVQRWGSKGAVLGIGLAQLVEAVLALAPDEPMHVVVDKHGGRNHYQPLLQEAIPGGWVLPLEEGMELSIYDVWGLSRPVRFTFLPRGDAGHFEVALASMISKYVRETLMVEFNRYWQEHVPGLTPTAGYPGDSRRFLDDIRPALQRLGIAEQLVWRER